MINPTGGNTQFPNNILQSGVQQTGVNPQNQLDKRAEDNKPQQNKTAEAATSQNTNKTSENRNFQEIAESILAKRQEQNTTSYQPAIERGAILDITV